MSKRRSISISKRTLDDILSIPTAPVGDHPTDEEFAAYVTDRIADIDVHKIDTHLASCPECCREVELLFEVVQSCPESEVKRRVELAAVRATALGPADEEGAITDGSERWLASPPNPVEVARYVAGQSPDDDAMRTYFSSPHAGMGRNLLGSLYVRALADLLCVAAAAREYRDEMQAGLADLARKFSGAIIEGAATREPGSAAAEITTPAVLALAARTSPAASYCSVGPAGTPLIAVTSDRLATAEIGLQTANSVRIRVVSAVKYTDRYVLVEVLSEQAGSVDATILLTESEGTDEARGEAVMAVDNVERLLRNCTVLIAWLPY